MIHVSRASLSRPVAIGILKSMKRFSVPRMPLQKSLRSPYTCDLDDPQLVVADVLSRDSVCGGPSFSPPGSDSVEDAFTATRRSHEAAAASQI